MRSLVSSGEEIQVDQCYDLGSHILPRGSVLEQPFDPMGARQPRFQPSLMPSAKMRSERAGEFTSSYGPTT